MKRISFDARIASPLSIAGYVAWATVSIGVWKSAASWDSWVTLSGRATASLFLCLFLSSYSFIAATPQPLKRSSRATALSVLIGSTLALMSAGLSDLSPILLIIVAVALADVLSTIGLSVALLTINGCFYLILALRWKVEDPWFVLLVYGSFQLFAAVTAAAKSRSEAMTDELRQVNAGLLATRALLTESARDAERLRLSRELHDVAGHGLTALKLNLEVLSFDPLLARRREVRKAQELVAQLLEDIRSVVSRLRQDDGIDLREALQRVAEPFPYPPINLDVTDGVRVEGAARADAMVRACQEALTNAVRHANATQIWVALAPWGSGIQLTVEDNGSYNGSHVPGHGLKGMQERVGQVGGSVESSRSSHGGFKLSVRLSGAGQ